MKNLKSLFTHSYLKNEPGWMVLGNEFNRPVMATGYPREIKEGWLDAIVSSEGNFDISIHCTPMEIDSVLTSLNAELVKQESDLAAAERKGIVNPSLRIQRADTMNVLEMLQKGEEKLFNMSLYVNCRANDKESLEIASKKVCAEMNSIMIIPKIPFMRMWDAVKSCLPIQKDLLKINRNITSSALAACFPFTTSFLNIDEEGILFGANAVNKIPVIINPFGLANYNGLILGTSGGGKSVLAKLLILRSQFIGAKVMIIDPQGEYSALASKYGGEVVEISAKSGKAINPFDLAGIDFGEKVLSLIDFFGILLGNLNEEQKSILDKAIQKIYSDKGIFHNNPETWKRQPPLISDLFFEISKELKKATKYEKRALSILENRLNIFVNGSFSFIDKHTAQFSDKKIVCFNVSEMPEALKPAIMFLIMEYIHGKMRSEKGKKILVVDEAWSLLKYAEHANRIFELVKTSRKFNMGIIIITQEAQDLLSTNAGNTIISNTAWKFFGRQEAGAIDQIAEKFMLNPSEQNILLNAQPGEGMLIAMNDHVPLNVIASEKELALVNTKPN